MAHSFLGRKQIWPWRGVNNVGACLLRHVSRTNSFAPSMAMAGVSSIISKCSQSSKLPSLFMAEATLLTDHVDNRGSVQLSLPPLQLLQSLFGVPCQRQDPELSARVVNNNFGQVSPVNCPTGLHPTIACHTIHHLQNNRRRTICPSYSRNCRPLWPKEQ